MRSSSAARRRRASTSRRRRKTRSGASASPTTASASSRSTSSASSCCSSACIPWASTPAPASALPSARRSPSATAGASGSSRNSAPAARFISRYRRKTFHETRGRKAMTDGRSPIEILLVEDNPGDERLTREALKEGRVYPKPHWAKDGVEAMEFLQQRGKYRDAPRPDIIPLDLNLPKKDGREVLQEIKSDEQLRRIPVVVLTTSKAEEDVLRSYNLHANCYITKPVHLDDFVGVLRQLEGFWTDVVRLPGA